MSSSEANLPRLDDGQRLQRLVDDINTKNASKRIAAHDLDLPAKGLLLEYSQEVTKSLIAAASVLAAHRGSTVIEERDVVLVLAKKMGIEMAGSDLAPVLHHYNFKSAIDSVDKAYKADRLSGTKRRSGDEDTDH